MNFVQEQLIKFPFFTFQKQQIESKQVCRYWKFVFIRGNFTLMLKQITMSWK